MSILMNTKISGFAMKLEKELLLKDYALLKKSSTKEKLLIILNVNFSISSFRQI